MVTNHESLPLTLQSDVQHRLGGVTISPLDNLPPNLVNYFHMLSKISPLRDRDVSVNEYSLTITL